MVLGLGLGTSVANVPYLQMTLPSGFTDRWSPPMTFFESAGGQYLTNYDYTTLKPAITKTYYVASATSGSAPGSDAAAGTQGAPLLSLSVALAKSDVDEVVIDCTNGDYIMLGTRGWSNTITARSLSVRKIGTGRAISVRTASTTLPTWVNVSGAIYKTTIGASSASSTIDLSITESDGFFYRQQLAASQEAMTAGTYYHDGTDLFVWASDSRNLVGDTKMLPCSTANNCRIASANLTTYIDGIDFVGGVPLNFTSAGVVDPLVVALNCTFQGCASNSQNNVSITGPGRFYFYRCGSARAWRDAFNYHGDGNGDPKYFENECWTGTSGYNTTSDNGSTAHENAAGVRLNCRYRGARQRTVADINDTRSIILGCDIGQSRNTGAGCESLAQQNTNQTWIGGSRFEAGSNVDLVIVNTATVAYRKMTAPTRAGTGEDAGTLTTW